MGRDFLQRIKRVFVISEAGSGADPAMIAVRYRTLQRQIPLLYAIILTNYIGFNLLVGIDFARSQHRINLLVLFVIYRLFHWVKRRNQELPPEEMRRELKKVFVFALLICALFAFWALRLSFIADPVQLSYVVLFASLAAIGSAYGLSSFPSAARLPLILIVLPLAARLVLERQPHAIAMGISLGLVSLLLMRLLRMQSLGLMELVRSRSAIEVERERAQKAEETALAEKAKAKEVADTDSLTGLANRRAFLSRLDAVVAVEGRTIPVTLAMIDLDGFKPINDTFGHATGDAVLREVGKRLRRAGGAGSLAARTGGDEFALLAPACTNRSQAARLGARIAAELRRPYSVDGREFRLSGGCGLLLIEPGDHDLTLALGRCDTALYDAKQRGRGEYALFTPAMEEVTRRRSEIERALRSAQIHEQVNLVYQPICDLETGRPHAMEALARWRHPELGMLSPAEFIPVAEQINAIEPVAAALLVRGAGEAARWPETVRLSFNLSAVQLCSSEAAQRILAGTAAAGLDPRRLQLEVTETALLVDFDAARSNLRRLREAGAHIVLDDFGAGYASLSYLREIDFDAIKLDGALVVSATESPSALRLLRGVVHLCASLGVPCVAEHVETEEQLALLRRLGCRYGQGYRLSRPLPAEEARTIARSKLLPLQAADDAEGSGRAAA